jgi:hypothetical protein
MSDAPNVAFVTKVDMHMLQLSASRASAKFRTIIHTYSEV